MGFALKSLNSQSDKHLWNLFFWVLYQIQICKHRSTTYSISLSQTLKKSWILDLPLAIREMWRWTFFCAPITTLCDIQYWCHLLYYHTCVYVCVYVHMTHWWNLSGRCRWCTAARRRWRWTHPLMSSEQWWCHGRRCTAHLLWRGGWELRVDETTTWFIMTIKLTYGHNHLDTVN